MEARAISDIDPGKSAECLQCLSSSELFGMLEVGRLHAGPTYGVYIKLCYLKDNLLTCVIPKLTRFFIVCTQEK